MKKEYLKPGTEFLNIVTDVIMEDGVISVSEDDEVGANKGNFESESDETPLPSNSVWSKED